MIVEPDHRIIAHGHHKMVLLDHQGGHAVIVAERHGDRWGINAIDTDHGTTADTRYDAIYAMTEMALALLPKDGYSTQVQPGLLEMP